MTVRERILSYAEDADWSIASLLRVLTEAGISQAGVNVIAIAREQIRVLLPDVLEELDETSRRPNPNPGGVCQPPKPVRVGGVLDGDPEVAARLVAQYPITGWD